MENQTDILETTFSIVESRLVAVIHKGEINIFAQNFLNKNLNYFADFSTLNIVYRSKKDYINAKQKNVSYKPFLELNFFIKTQSCFHFYKINQYSSFLVTVFCG